jgi:hypothetical protein
MIKRTATGNKYLLYFGATSTPGGIVSDRNVLFINSSTGTINATGYAAIPAGTTYTTLQNWKTAGFDANSISADPIFRDTLYYPSNLAIDNLGAPLGVQYDFYGKIRNMSTPDAGAFEFTGSVLPVTIINLSATKVNQNAIVNWTTASEVNFKHFEVERSANGRDFIAAGTVSAKGTTTALTSYSFTDEGIMSYNNRHYYRLRMVNKDGSYSYSKVVMVNINELNAELVTVYPNPVIGDVYVKISTPAAGMVNVRMIDLAGKALVNRTEQIGMGTTVLHLGVAQKLPQGVYTVTVELNGKRFSYRLTK